MGKTPASPIRRLALLRARPPSRHTNKQIIELASYYEGRKGGIAHAKRGAGLTPTACVRAFPGCACRRRPGGPSPQASPRFLTTRASGTGIGSLRQSRKSLRLPSLISRRTESPATIKARAADERGRLTSRSTSGTNSGTGDSRTSRKLVNFRTLTWQSSQGESKEDSGPPTF